MGSGSNKKQASPEEDLKDRLKFETLLTDISAHFVNLPAREVDSEIMDAERRICEAFDLDVAAVWQWVDETQCFALTTSYSAQAGPVFPDQSSALQSFPWYQEQIRNGRIVAISSLPSTKYTILSRMMYAGGERSWITRRASRNPKPIV